MAEDRPRRTAMEWGNPILVTGSHRSGSTWTGRMLAAAPGVGYILEPFHVGHRPGIFAAKTERWFTYVTTENEGPYLRAAERTLQFRYDLAAELRRVRSPKDAARMTRDWTRFSALRFRRARPLMKDPIALLSAEWLAERFRMDVLILIRHPAAFVMSLRRLGWQPPFDDLVSQPLLVRDRLGPYMEEIDKARSGPSDPLTDGALLWKILHASILGYRDRHTDWLFRRHEDLSRNPIPEFEDLYARLGLSFEDGVRRILLEHTAPGRASREGDPRSLRRDSAKEAAKWKAELSTDELRRIRETTEEVSRHFYDDRDWG